MNIPEITGVIYSTGDRPTQLDRNEGGWKLSPVHIWVKFPKEYVLWWTVCENDDRLLLINELTTGSSGPTSAERVPTCPDCIRLVAECAKRQQTSLVTGNFHG